MDFNLFALELEQRRKEVKIMIDELRPRCDDPKLFELIAEHSRNFTGGPLTLTEIKKILPFIKE